MRIAMAFGLAALALGGCVPMAGPQTVAPPLRISYSTGACFGACPVYALSVDSAGNGTFEGKRFTSAAGQQRFTATPAQFEAFVQALARFRPRGEKFILPGQPGCGPAATDMPGVDISWQQGSRTDHLSVYFGCDMDKNRAMFDALRAAPKALPVQGLIGAHS